MPDEQESITKPPERLPVDADVDRLIAGAGIPPDEPVWEEERADHDAMIQRAALADDAQRFGIARRYRAETARLDALMEERQAVWDQYSAAIDPIAARRDDLGDILDAMALVRREAGLGNFMDVPGIGRWSTTRYGVKWQIVQPVALDLLREQEATEFIDPGEPRPPIPTVRVKEFRAHLNELLDTALAGRKKPTDEEIAEVAQAVAAAYPGAVEVTPPVINVKGKLEGARDGGSDDSE